MYAVEKGRSTKLTTLAKNEIKTPSEHQYW